jgi:hypothetical protein
LVLNRAVGPVGRAGHPGTQCAVLACILLHTCRTRVLPNASDPRSCALITARHASLIWRAGRRCWWLFTICCAGSSAGTRYESSAVVVCRGGGGKRKTSAHTARRTRRTHPTGRDSARAMMGWREYMHARSQEGGMRTGRTGTTDGHTDTRTGHAARSLLGQLLSSHRYLSLSDRHSGLDPPRLRARRRSARHRYLHGCKVRHM